jgi:hypothetical protein
MEAFVIVRPMFILNIVSSRESVRPCCLGLATYIHTSMAVCASRMAAVELCVVCGIPAGYRNGRGGSPVCGKRHQQWHINNPNVDRLLSVVGGMAFYYVGSPAQGVKKFGYSHTGRSKETLDITVSYKNAIEAATTDNAPTMVSMLNGFRHTIYPGIRDWGDFMESSYKINHQLFLMAADRVVNLQSPGIEDGIKDTYHIAVFPYVKK